MSYGARFRVKPGSKVKLDDIDPNFTGKHENQKSSWPKLEKYSQKLHDLQYLLYAEGKQSLLICLQGLDGAGKDGNKGRPSFCSSELSRNPTLELDSELNSPFRHPHKP